MGTLDRLDTEFHIPCKLIRHQTEAVQNNMEALHIGLYDTQTLQLLLL